MEKILDIYKKYYVYILFGLLFVIIVLSDVLMFVYLNKNVTLLKKDSSKNKEVVEVEEEKEVKKYIVDIKGEVKKPGIYLLEENSRVWDVVKKAGGLTKDADTYVNNLSMKIFDEMVIVIYSKDEIKDYLNTKEKEKNLEEKCTNDIIKNDSCSSNKEESAESSTDKESDNSKEENKLVNINTASKEELMTVSGIGESKALAIIEYRKEHLFEKIEDIKNVSGIGDSLFEKIKNYITV